MVKQTGKKTEHPALASLQVGDKITYQGKKGVKVPIVKEHLIRVQYEDLTCAVLDEEDYEARFRSGRWANYEPVASP